MDYQILLDISNTALEMRVALDKAMAATDAMHDDYFSSEKPDASLLASDYQKNLNLCAIVTDYLFDASKHLYEIEKLVDCKGETA